MGNDRRWTAALAEHETVVGDFLAACAGIQPNDWQRAPAQGKWSPAALALHVCRAYELGRSAIAGGPGMRLLVAPSAAWFARTVFLPALLATKRFPRGARSPREVVPDAAEASLLSPGTATARMKSAADSAAEALRRAAVDHPAIRVTHAYFGALTPYETLRLLSAHTRHHAAGLAHSAVQAPRQVARR